MQKPLAKPAYFLRASADQWPHGRFEQRHPGPDQKSLRLSEQGAFQNRYLFPLRRTRPLSGPMKKHQNIPEEANFEIKSHIIFSWFRSAFLKFLQETNSK